MNTASTRVTAEAIAITTTSLKQHYAAGVVWLLVGLGSLLAAAAWGDPPEPKREFRAAWIATVANIDWPSKPGLSATQQREEMIAWLDRARALRLNAVVLQVRPACDAIYKSDLEPWSPYLSGKMGVGPSDGYDPLEFAVTEAHRRGLELHAWFNPYRALHPTYKGAISADHVSKRHPEFVREYGTYQWLDPGDEGAVEHSRKVILDVVERYDIDAVHFDDYFYPYPVTDDKKRPVPFPDDASWQKYVEATPEGERLSRDDWRRENVNNFLRTLGRDIKRAKPWVRFGVSPFGIYRPGQPPSIKGFDPYEKLYADSKLWLEEGIVDYLAPQLYWPIDQQAQSFPVLFEWWQQQNPQGRHIWPGLYTSQVTGREKGWPNEEIVRQIELVRERSAAPGHIHFSIKALRRPRSGLGNELNETTYTELALPPATPWCTQPVGANLEFTLNAEGEENQTRLSVETAEEESPWLWLVQWQEDETWHAETVAGTKREWQIPVDNENLNELAVRAVDRVGNLGPVVTVSARD